MTTTTMTEDQIERRVKTTMDNIDRKYLAGKLSDGGYVAAVAAIHDWAEAQFRVWQVRMLRA